MFAIDQLVQSITPYTVKPIVAHAYVGPFIVLYGSWLYVWCGLYGISEYWELGCIVMAGIGLLQVLTVLFCHWFVSMNCLFTCSHEPDVHKATTVKVTPTPNNGWTEMVPLQRTKLFDGRLKLWFEFQKVHYTFDEDKKQFRSFELDTNKPMKYFQESKGLETDEAIVEAKQDLGDNHMEMVIPQFMELFKERATAPFFVFQVFCVGLWCLEDMWYYSVFTLMMLMTFEATLVKQQLKNMSEIRNMGNKAYQIYAYRNKRWNRIKSDELLPGDIVSVGRSPDEQAVPCDLLLLRGPCIVDESMLTGESVPQMKEPIEDVEKTQYFDFECDSRLHVIFGGTKIVQHTPPAKNEAGIKAPDGGCICYVLRTGFNTSQGRLLRTIMFGVKRVTANNRETFAFILFLLIFAIAASVYLWIKGSEDESRSKYKLFLECSLILTSVIPPELPIELSLAVNNSLMALQKLGITLVNGDTEDDDDLTIIRSPADAPVESIQVLVACHSLVRFDEDLVGDPLEKACLSWAEWNLTKTMKRMTVIAGYMLPGTSDTKHLVAVKGAPETLKNMVINYGSVPDDYDKTYQKLTRQGARVLALAIKEVGTLSYQEIRDRKREEFECDLKFVGFVVISCPLKADTKMIVKEIIESSHRVVMITGDNPLTACHVAKVLRFTNKSKPVLVLDEPDQDGESNWSWKSVSGNVTAELIPVTKSALTDFIASYEFCMTGTAFAYLLQNHLQFLRKILPHITVFARMAPKQKERIINELKSLGYITLMCGDGTNDVGALKHADVGVALLSHPFDASKVEESLKKKEEDAKALVAAGAPNAQTDHLSSHAHSAPPAAAGIANGPPRRLHSARRNDAPVGARQLRHSANSAQSPFAKRLHKMLKEMEEETQLVKLGDASFAAPFTSKYTSIQSSKLIRADQCSVFLSDASKLNLFINCRNIFKFIIKYCEAERSIIFET
ncbi:unnamed protein product [Anisakis simplex]|nr:unnamed protein product [Anisakis simplex]